jgi:glutathione S-transferase
MGAQADPRDDSQQARERAMTEVSDVLVNVEHAITRAKKARTRLGDSPDEHNARLALVDALRSLEAVRKRLQRDTYFGGDELRLV